MKTLFTKTRFQLLSQVFANLSAGWFGVVLIVPGVTQLANLGDWVWLTKNMFFGIVSLFIAEQFAERGKI